MENSQQLTPTCTQNKTVYQVCINPKCTQVCFICCDDKCQCQALHQSCDKFNWNYIIKKLNRDLIKHTPEFKSFSNTLDQEYQNTIKVITKAYDDFKIWKDDFGLTEFQSSFLHLIEEAKMYEIRKEIRKPSKMILKSENKFEEEAESINKYTEKLIEQLKSLYSQNKVIKQRDESSKKRIEEIIYKFHDNSSRFKEIQNLKKEKLLFAQSKINGLSKQLQNYQTNQILVQVLDYYKKVFQQIDSQFKKFIKDYDQQKLTTDKLEQELVKIESEAQKIGNQVLIKIEKQKGQNFFNFFNKKMKSYNLLYRASQNNFQVSKFWDKCNGKTNTLTILKTQFGKIIGGYTPLAWNNSIGGSQQDKSKQTFLFSITQKHKLPISKNQANALYHSASSGPTFYSDLNIQDKANVTENQGYIGNVYNNGEYNKNQQGYKKWSGQSNGYNFLIQQWEVYEIKFEE